MKIVYFNYIDNAIGPLIRTLEIAKACSDNGIHVVLYFMHPRFNPPESIIDRIESYQNQNLRIRYTKINPPPPVPQAVEAINITPKPPRMTTLGLLKQAILSLKFIPQELKIIKQEKPDALMARPDHAFSFCFSAKFTQKPLILEADGPIEELDLYWDVSSKHLKRLDTFRARTASAVLCISRVCKELWLNKGLPADKLFIVPNGAHPNEFSPQPIADRQALKNKLGLTNCKVIGYSGNQRVWHGLSQLLNASLPHLQSHPEVKLLIIGCGKNVQLLQESKIPDDIIDKQIIFTGRLSYTDMAKYIDLADMMVMPYDILPIFYFSPMRMFEAMSAGKLLITSKQGQMADILDDRSAVMFFEPTQEKDLERVLGEAIKNEQLPATGMRNRAYLLAEHTWLNRGQTIHKALQFALNK